MSRIPVFLKIQLVATILLSFTFSPLYGFYLPTKTNSSQPLSYTMTMDFGASIRDYEYDLATATLNQEHSSYGAESNVFINNILSFSDKAYLGISIGESRMENGTFKFSGDKFETSGDPGFGWGANLGTVYLSNTLGMDWFLEGAYRTANSDWNNGENEITWQTAKFGWTNRMNKIRLGFGTMYVDAEQEIVGTTDKNNRIAVAAEASDNIGVFLSSDFSVNTSTTFYLVGTAVNETSLEFGMNYHLSGSPRTGTRQDKKSSRDSLRESTVKEQKVKEQDDQKVEQRPEKPSTNQESDEMDVQEKQKTDPDTEVDEKQTKSTSSQTKESSTSKTESEKSLDWKETFTEARKSFDKENFTAAKSKFKKVLNQVPEHVDTLLWLGVIESKLGNLKNARKYFERTLEFDPENNYAKRSLQKIKKQLNKSQ